MIVTATYKYDLSDDDIERIAERVVRKLEINSNKQKLLNHNRSSSILWCISTNILEMAKKE